MESDWECQKCLEMAGFIFCSGWDIDNEEYYTECLPNVTHGFGNVDPCGNHTYDEIITNCEGWYLIIHNIEMRAF